MSSIQVHKRCIKVSEDIMNGGTTYIEDVRVGVDGGSVWDSGYTKGCDAMMGRVIGQHSW